MSLTTCPDCDREVSTRAAACPHCGAPGPAADSSVTTVAKTGKGLKLQEIASLFLVLLGGAGLLYQLVMGRKSLGEGATILSAAILGTGFVWFGLTRFRTWWQHG